MLIKIKNHKKYQIAYKGGTEMMKLMKVIAYSGLAGTSLSFLWHFSNILKYGEFYICEPSSLILYSEMGLTGALFILAVSLIIVEIRSD